MPFKKTFKGVVVFNISLAVFVFFFISNVITVSSQAADVCSSLMSDDPGAGQGKPLSSLDSCQKSCKTACRQEKKAGNTHCYSCLNTLATCFDIGASPANVAWCMPGGACASNPASYCQSVGSGLGLACVICKPIPDECKQRIGANTSNLATCQQTCNGKCVFVNQYQAVNNPAKWVGCYKCQLPPPPTCESLGWGTTTPIACAFNCPAGQCNPVKMFGGFGNNGPLGLSLTCFQCQKNPPPPPVKDIRCYEGQVGECEDDSCPANQECQGYTEKSTSGETYYCHNCNDLDECQLRGYASSPNCEGECSDGETCESVDVDKDSGNVVGAGRTRSKGSTVPCYKCVAHPVVSPQGCSGGGYFSDDTCGGECSGSECEAEAIDKQTHEPLPQGKTVDANTVETCYACNPHVEVEETATTEETETPAPASLKQTAINHCDVGDEGSCSPNPCPDDQGCKMISKKSNGAPYDCYLCYEKPKTETVVPPTNTTPVTPGHTDDRFKCYSGQEGNCILNPCPSDQECVMTSARSRFDLMDCYICKEKSNTAKRKTCEDMGMSDGDDCVHSCASKGGTCVQKSEDDYGTKCWECQNHKIALNLCPPGAQLGPCPGSCGAGEQCISLPGQCYTCKKNYSAFTPSSCAASGASDNPSCDGKCAASDCIEQSLSLPYGDGYQREKCYMCKPHYSAYTPFSCTKADDSSDPLCDGKCLSSDCFQDSVLVPGSASLYEKCYYCKKHFIVPNTPVTETGIPPVNAHECMLDGDYSDPACNGNCPASDCLSEMMNNNTHRPLPPWYNPPAGSAYTCYYCRPTKEQIHDDECWDDGYYADPTCDDDCPEDECVSERVDRETGDVVPAGMTVAEGTTNVCYYCELPTRESAEMCWDTGYHSSSFCGDDCPPSDCYREDIDAKTHKVVPLDQTVESGSTYPCYVCRRHYLGYISGYGPYAVVVDENPFERYVLGEKWKNTFDPTVFVPSSVIALAQVDPSTGMIPNVNGVPQKVTDFTGSLNAGYGPAGITSTGTVSLDQLSGSIKNSLSSGGSYGASCFNEVQDQADRQASSAGTATSDDISKGRQGPQDRGKEDQAVDEGQIQKSQDAGAPAISGPVLACGTQNGNKVLKIYDGDGNLVASITQDMLRSDSNIIQEKLKAAQDATNSIMQGSSGGQSAGAGISALPLRDNQSSSVDQGAPNDPLYQEASDKQHKTFFFGLLGGGPAPVAATIESPFATAAAPELDVKDQYYLRAIGFTPLSDPNSAWNVVDMTQKNVVVALVDSGLDLSHPDGPQYLWTNPQDGSHGWNFVDDNNTDFTDYRGHGTFVAGIIAAKWNNGTGIAGINPGAVIMPIKVTDDKGKTSSLAIWRGINFAVDHGAKIINVSLGGKDISKLEQLAIERANAMGALVVIAAGNTNDDLMSFGPSSSKYALSVGMLDFDGQRSLVSNWGPNVQLVAPGEQIWSLCSKDTKDALPSVRKYGYEKQSGTSFSTPMVTATASLVWAHDPSLTNSQVADIIRVTAKPMYNVDWNYQTGFGLLNAAAALRATAGDHLIAMITNLHFNFDNRHRLTSLDVYGTVRGNYRQFTVEAGRGKMPGGYNQIAGPFQGQYDYKLIARFSIRDVLRGSDEWVLRLKVIDAQGNEHYASTHFIFPGK